MTADDIKKRILDPSVVPDIPDWSRTLWSAREIPPRLVETVADYLRTAPDAAKTVQPVIGGTSDTVSARVGVSDPRSLRTAVLPAVITAALGAANTTRFRDEAERRARAAKAVAEAAGMERWDEAFMAAFLLDAGAVALNLVLPEGYSASLPAFHNDGSSLLEAEREAVGVDRALAAKWLLERWGAPWPITAAVWLARQVRTAEAVLPNGNAITDVINVVEYWTRSQPGAGATLPPYINTCLGRLGLAAASVGGALEEIAASEVPKNPSEAPPPRRNFGATGRAHPAVSQLVREAAGARDASAVIAAIARALEAEVAPKGGVLYVAPVEDDTVHGACWGRPLSCVTTFSVSEDVAWEDLPVDVQACLRMHLPTVTAPDPEQVQRGGPASWQRALLSFPLSAEGRRLGQVSLELAHDLVTSEITELVDVAALLLNQALHFDRINRMSEALATAMARLERGQRRMRRVERLTSLGQMAEGAAHHINNPLAIISGQAQILLRRQPTPELARALEAIVQQSRRASRILNELMQFARPAQPNPAPTRISGLLHQILSVRRDRWAQRGIRIHEDYRQDAPPAATDRQQIRQVFEHLIDNAEQAMAKGGGLTVRTKASEDGKAVIVRIADTGAGIAPEHLDKVFEPFFSTREGEPGATGLGLSVCHTIVERHHGAITLESPPEGGCVCTVTLPAAAAEAPASTPAPAPSAQAPTAPAEQGATAANEIPETVWPVVLVVVEDDDLRVILEQSLGNRGYSIQSAADGLEAMATVLSQHIDLMICDISMRGWEDEPLIRQVHSRLTALPILALVGADPGDAEYARQQGAAATLRKPFAVEHLLNRLAETLRPGRAAKQA